MDMVAPPSPLAVPASNARESSLPDGRRRRARTDAAAPPSPPAVTASARTPSHVPRTLLPRPLLARRLLRQVQVMRSWGAICSGSFPIVGSQGTRWRSRSAPPPAPSSPLARSTGSSPLLYAPCNSSYGGGLKMTSWSQWLLSFKRIWGGGFVLGASAGVNTK
jgi:hypothetical protein